jgi:hypothetical protein
MPSGPKGVCVRTAGLSRRIGKDAQDRPSSAFACGPIEPAGPLRCPGFPVQRSGLGELRAAFFTESRIRRFGQYRDAGKSRSAPVGMTKLNAVAHLGMSGGGWTDSKKLIWTKLILSRPLRQAQGRLFGTELWIDRLSRSLYSPIYSQSFMARPKSCPDTKH